MNAYGFGECMLFSLSVISVSVNDTTSVTKIGQLTLQATCRIADSVIKIFTAVLT